MIMMIILGELNEVEREINKTERARNCVLVQLVGPLPMTGNYFGLFRVKS